MKLSAAIMAHPVRAELAEQVQAALDRPTPIVYDEVPTPSKDPRQRWANGRRAWEAHDPTADWHMVIQDDALVCEDLLAGLEKALAVLGRKGLVSAFTSHGKPEHTHVRRAWRTAVDKGHAWMCTKSLCWGVAIIAPVRTIPKMLDWCSAPGQQDLTYDMRIGRYYRDKLGWRTWYTVPSLVDHRDGPSLVGHGEADRRANGFLQGSALDVLWHRVPQEGLQVKW